jgi:hypothetical protein
MEVAGNRTGRRVEGIRGMLNGSKKWSGRCGAPAAVLTAAVLVALAGCEERRDPLASAVRDARNVLVSASGGGGAALGPESRKRAYDKVISSLQGAEREGTPMTESGRDDALWLGDARVQPGGCLVEGRDRIIDGRVDTALDRTYRRLTYTQA